MKPVATEIIAESTGAPEAPAAAPRSTSIVTRMKFAASPEQTWNALIFYEQIAERPPLHLRVLLPLPIRTEGRKSRVGDAVKCVYEGGYLEKRVTRIERGRDYEFEVVEQDLTVGGGMRLLRGGYTLRELPCGGVEVALETRYLSPKHPRWLWKPIEAAVCHTFHRHILGTMRRNAESSNRLVATRTHRRERPPDANVSDRRVPDGEAPRRDAANPQASHIDEERGALRPTRQIRVLLRVIGGRVLLL
jgi:hypothetical protein